MPCDFKMMPWSLKWRESMNSSGILQMQNTFNAINSISDSNHWAYVNDWNNERLSSRDTRVFMSWLWHLEIFGKVGRFNRRRETIFPLPEKLKGLLRCPKADDYPGISRFYCLNTMTYGMIKLILIISSRFRLQGRRPICVDPPAGQKVRLGWIYKWTGITG
jgi:hypothetical protein